MVRSYVPETVNVICTAMTCKGPLKLGLCERTCFVNYTAESHPLLNITDKKISDTFNCNISGGFWGGLQTLTAVLAIGALAVATIVTGGLAAVAVGVFFLAASTSIVSGTVGLYKIAHDCDKTLSDASKWELFHEGVKFEQHHALLQDSVLMCEKGGAISIVLDDELAIQIAEFISSNNMEAFYWHMGSQALIGAITVAAAFSPIGIVVAFPLSVYGYVNGEDGPLNNRKYNRYALVDDSLEEKNSNILANLGGAAKDEALINTPVGTMGAIFEGTITVTAANQAVTNEMREFGTEIMIRTAQGDVVGAQNMRLAQDIASRSYQSMNWAGILKGIRNGLVAAIASFAMNEFANSKEDDLYKENLDELKRIRELDRKRSFEMNIKAEVR